MLKKIFLNTIFIYFILISTADTQIIIPEHLKNSREYYFNNQYDKVIEILNKNYNNLYAKEKFLLGLSYKKSEQYKKSINVFKEILPKIEILKPLVLYHLGDIYAKLKDYDKSNKFLIELYKSNYNYKNLNEKTLFKIIENYKQLESQNKILEYYNIIEKKYLPKYSYYNDVFLDIPLKPDIWFEQATIFLNSNQYKKSYSKLSDIIKHYTRSNAAYSAANLIIKNSELTKIFNNSNDKIFKLSLYETLFNKGKFKFVIPNFKKLLNYFVKTKNKKILPKLRYMLARSYYKLKDYDNALPHFRIIQKYYSTSDYAPKSVFYIGIIYLRKNDNKKYLKYMNKVINNYNNHYFNFASFKEILSYYENKNNTKKLDKILNRMINFFNYRKQYNYVKQSYWRYIFFNYKYKNYSKALTLLKKLKKQNHTTYPEKIKINFWIAKLYLKTDKTKINYYLNLNINTKEYQNYYFWKSVELFEKINNKKTKIKVPSVLSEKILINEIKKLSEQKPLFKYLAVLRDYENLYLVTDIKYTKLNMYLSFLNNEFNQAILYSYKLNNSEKKDNLFLFYPDAYKNYIETYSKIFNLDNYLPYSIMREKSRFVKSCISSAGAIGLMQIMPSTGRTISRWLNEKGFITDNLFIPEINIKFGVYYLKRLYDKWSDQYKDLTTALVFSIASYNAGEFRVKQWIKTFYELNNDLDYFIELIPYNETRNYVRRVYRSIKIYSKQ
jgi:soluble lytic murein transglycosylase